VVERLTDILEDEEKPQSLKDKVLQLLKTLVDNVTEENIMTLAKIAEPILSCIAYYTPANPQLTVCIGILVTLCSSAGPIISFLRERDWSSFFSLYLRMIEQVNLSDLRRAGWEGLYNFVLNQRIARSFFRRLPPNIQRKLIDMSLEIIKYASDVGEYVVTKCIAVLSWLVKESTEFLTKLKERATDCFRFLFKIVALGVNYSANCVRDILQTLRLFGDEAVENYVREHRNSIDADKLERRSEEWNSDYTWRRVLGDLIDWFKNKICHVLDATRNISRDIVEFVEEHPIVTGMVTLGGIFAAIAIATRSSRSQEAVTESAALSSEDDY
ncbi:hypothetical protein WDU94_005749, partial [Cyamophila willieti]